jgi:hypothetical protein
MRVLLHVVETVALWFAINSAVRACCVWLTVRRVGRDRVLSVNYRTGVVEVDD